MDAATQKVRVEVRDLLKFLKQFWSGKISESF